MVLIEFDPSERSFALARHTGSLAIGGAAIGMALPGALGAAGTALRGLLPRLAPFAGGIVTMGKRLLEDTRGSIRLPLGDLARARDAIARLPNSLFRPLQCTQCTTAMVDALKSQGLRGEVLSIKANGGFQNIVNDLVGPGRTITENGLHQAVKIGDMVFDNFLRNGVPYEVYVNSLHAPMGVAITAAGF